MKMVKHNFSKLSAFRTGKLDPKRERDCSNYGSLLAGKNFWRYANGFGRTDSEDDGREEDSY
ncbi:MAG: hypothetical protein NTY86_18655 [Deltaproteobacteria bacterium]|nr:hypothetical protein [Deltaproteobacteria bacterium]